MPATTTLKPLERARELAEAAERRADLAWDCGAHDTARHARRSAILHRRRAEELEGEQFVSVPAGG